MVMDRFNFSNGESVGSLEEFVVVLRNLDEDTFFHHTGEGRNDFANWIRDCVKKKALANKISKLTGKEDIVEEIEKSLDTPAKKKMGIIDQIKSAILDNG